MSARDVRPLIAHVVYRFDIGGLRERRRQPDQPACRASATGTRCRADRGDRRSASASCATTSSSSSCTSRRGMASGSSRACSAVPATAAGDRPHAQPCCARGERSRVARRRAGAHPRRARPRHRRSRRLQPHVPARAPRSIGRSSTTTSRCRDDLRATTCVERIGVRARERHQIVQWRRHRALPLRRRRRAASPAARSMTPALWLVGTVGRMQPVKNQATAGARVRARARAARRRCARGCASSSSATGRCAPEMLDVLAARGVRRPGVAARRARRCRRRAARRSTASCCRRSPKASRTPSSKRWRAGCRSSRPTSAAMPSWSTTDATGTPGAGRRRRGAGACHRRVCAGDPSWRARHRPRGASARRARFSLDAMVAAYRALYDTLLARARNRCRATRPPRRQARATTGSH